MCLNRLSIGSGVDLMFTLVVRSYHDTYIIWWSVPRNPILQTFSIIQTKLSMVVLPLTLMFNSHDRNVFMTSLWNCKSIHTCVQYMRPELGRHRGVGVKFEVVRQILRLLASFIIRKLEQM